MGDILSIASAMLTNSQLRVESSGRNIVHYNDPAYRRSISFSSHLEQPVAEGGTIENSAHEFSSGKYLISDNPLDLAIEGEGFFVVSDGATSLYTRSGSFRLREGRLVDPRGYVLQAAEGGDLMIGDGTPSFAFDGLALRDGVPAGRVAIVDFADRSTLRSDDGVLFSGPAEAAVQVERPALRQGMTEGSNVAMADEMVRMMAALRGAETGQRLVQAYDDLLGRALTAFGGNG